MYFAGYPRISGQTGTRNLTAIIPTVFCANHVARKIADAVPGAVAFPHAVGCGYPGPDQTLTAHVLRRMAEHPNFGAVLLVGLGCERVVFADIISPELVDEKKVRTLLIQEEGDSVKALQKGVAVAQDLTQALAMQKPEKRSLNELVLGLKCGGTDAASGVAANPALGIASDLLIANGGSSILTEITELCGAEHIMRRRATSGEIGDCITSCVTRNVDRLYRATGAVQDSRAGGMMLVSPGNADGGVSNVVEKALGGLKKAGNAIFQGVIRYGAPLPGTGLYLMDGPGHDGEAVTGLAASGATVIVFTTGRGTPAGYPGVPVIKVTGNPQLFSSMQANLDFDAGVLFSRQIPLEDIGKDLFDCIVRTASGAPVKAELLGHEELFCISRFMATHMHFEGAGILSSPWEGQG